LKTTRYFEEQVLRKRPYTHELIHLIHPHHGQPFYDLLEILMPDWRSRKQRLEKILA
jgi:hypothetical protein